MKYIAGPMTGHEDFNQPAFREAAERLRAAGHVVLSPIEVAPASGDWAGNLRRDLIAMLMLCDSVIVLPGWEKSKGANLEVHVASVLGMDIITYAEALP